MVQSVVVVAGGGPAPLSVRDRLPEGATLVAADGGVDTALALGLRIDVVVGDLDSVTAAGLAEAEAHGARVDRHPAAKDATDLALALELAAELVDSGGEIVVVGVDGGRLDHLLAGVLALAVPGLPTVRAYLGPATVLVLHGPAEVAIDEPLGSLLTLVPVGGPADGVRTSGLRYPLFGERLAPGTTRGVSNVVEAEAAAVGVDAGSLLVVLPGLTETEGAT